MIARRSFGAVCWDSSHWLRSVMAMFQRLVARGSWQRRTCCSDSSGWRQHGHLLWVCHLRISSRRPMPHLPVTCLVSHRCCPWGSCLRAVAAASQWTVGWISSLIPWHVAFIEISARTLAINSSVIFFKGELAHLVATVEKNPCFR